MEKQEAVSGLSFSQGINLTTLPPILSREQFAVFIGTTADTVRGWMQSNTIPSVKVGRQRLVNVALLVRDLHNGKTIFNQGDYQRA